MRIRRVFAMCVFRGALVAAAAAGSVGGLAPSVASAQAPAGQAAAGNAAAEPTVADLIKNLSAKEWPVRFEAAEALGKLDAAGAAAVPQLIQALGDKETAVRTAAASALGELGPHAAGAFDAVEKAAADPEPEVRVRAIWALARLGEGKSDRVAKLVPALLKELSSKTPGVPEEAVEALGEIGAPAVPGLAELLKSGDPKQAALAAEALAEIGPQAKGAIQGLVAALGSQDETVARNAAAALGQIGAPDPAALRALTQGLLKGSPQVKAEIAACLGKIAREKADAIASGKPPFEAPPGGQPPIGKPPFGPPGGKPPFGPPGGKPPFPLPEGPPALGTQAGGPAAIAEAIAGLLKSAKDGDPRVRRAVLEALGAVGPRGPILRAILADALQDPDSGVRMEAAAILGEMGAEALPACEAALAKAESRQAALLVIGHLGPAGKPIAAKLLPLLETETPEMRGSVLLALANIGADDAATVAAVSKQLADPTPGVRNAALYALGKEGPKAAAAVPALEKLVAAAEGADDVSATVAAWALAKIQPDDANRTRVAVERIVGGLCKCDAGKQYLYLEALSELKAPAKLVLTEVQKHLGHLDPRNVDGVLHTLASLGGESVPVLTEALKDKDVRVGATAVLGGLGEAAAPAVPALAAGLSDPDADYRRETLLALGRLGSVAEPAYAAIAARLTAADAQPPEQQAVCFALGRLGKDAGASLPALAGIVSGKTPGPKIAAAWATANIDPNAADATIVNLLTEGLGNPRPEIREIIAETLGNLGAKAASATAALKQATADHDPGVSAAATAALEKIGK